MVAAFALPGSPEQNDKTIESRNGCETWNEGTICFFCHRLLNRHLGGCFRYSQLSRYPLSLSWSIIVRRCGDIIVMTS